MSLYIYFGLWSNLPSAALQSRCVQISARAAAALQSPNVHRGCSQSEKPAQSPAWTLDFPSLSQELCAVRIQGFPEENFGREHLRPPSGFAFAPTKLQELLPGIALSFRFSANPNVCLGPGFQSELVRKRFAAALS